MRITKKDFFFCYNPKLSNHLWKNGFRYEMKAINPDNNRIFTMYIKSDELQRSIDEYRQLNK